MLVFSEKNKYIIIFVIIVGCLLGGICVAKMFQPQSKNIKIYQQALKDYQNGNYSNSYFLFSKISHTSKLKPIAIYRQALCAKALGDDKAELKAYQAIFHNFPTNKLSAEAKYQAGQLLIESNPKLASRYFNEVIKSNIDTDYKIASEYYKSKIEISKLRYSEKNIQQSKMKKLEAPMRQYIEKFPDGRLAVNAANTWKKLNPELKSSDSVLVAKTYYLAGLYKDASEIIQKSTTKDNWQIQAVNLYALKNIKKANSIIEEGISKYSQNTNSEDYKRAIDEYLKHSKSNTYEILSELLEKANGKGKDYIWLLKCNNAPQNEQIACYNSLYANYPSGEFAQETLSKIFFNTLKQKDYVSAKNIGKDFITRFPNSEQIPQIMFWVGKIEQKTYDSSAYIKYFQHIINTYPDSYYAYRAFWILKNVPQATISAKLEYKPVLYPYKYPPAGDILSTLMQVNDYDMIAKLTKDEFIKSWVEYQKGNYSVSAYLAQEAMDKIEKKPVKTDLRWRLVYPQNYYKQVKNNADIYKNNDALMISIIREESHFNSEAQSSVGAIGLMQLMPATAHEIGAKNGLNFNTSYLFNPELNIKVGNLYYSTIRGMLNNQDISAIAAYNGGIGSVTRWKSTLKYSDIDEFVEQIPYEETRNYVKKVFRSYWNYTRIYQQ